MKPFANALCNTIMSAGCIRFVSDLHLGHEDSFAKAPEDLAFLLEGCASLVVCGDLSEDRESIFQEESLRQRAIFEEMCRRSGVELISIAGNHDPKREPDLLYLMGGSVVALHGHCLYKEVAPWSWDFLLHKEECGELIAQFPDSDTNLDSRMKLARAMSQRNKPVILHAGKAGKRSLIDRFAHIFWPPARPVAILRAWMTMDARMFRFARQFFPKAGLICYGHFHRRHIARKHGVTAVNLGAFVKHATSYVVDLENGTATVREASIKGLGRTVRVIHVPERS